MGGKNSAGGPMWVVKQEDLLKALKQEQQHLNDLLAGLAGKISDQAIRGLVQEQIQEVVKVARLWMKFYHSIVLLNAALVPLAENAIWRYPSENEDDVVRREIQIVDENGVNRTVIQCFLPESHMTAAWTDENNSEENWLEYDIPNYKTCSEARDASMTSENVVIDSLSGIFEQEFNRSFILTENFLTIRMAQSRYRTPILFRFLKSFNEIFSDFREVDMKSCLVDCLASAEFLTSSQLIQFTNPSPNANKKIYIEKALYLIAEIWAGEVSDKLPDGFWGEDSPDLIMALQGETAGEFEAWFEKAKSRLTKIKAINWPQNINANQFRNWLRAYHWPQSSMESSEDLLTKALAFNDDEVSKLIRGMVAMLEVNEKQLMFIYPRCFDGSSTIPHPGLEGLIEKLDFKFSPATSEENARQQYEQYLTAWTNLQFATYGILVWHMLHQITPTVEQVRTRIVGVSP